jgi:DNA polymerase-3 subunit delta'
MWPRVIGQERVKLTLLSALRSGRLPHAYLFYGPEGVGKDAMALELSRLIHCTRGGEEACGECDSCEMIRTMQHPDVRLITSLPLGKGEEKGDPPLAKLSQDELTAVREEYRRKGENPYARISIPKANIIKINSIRELRREATMTSYGGRKRVFLISCADEMGDEASNALLKTLEEPSGDCVIILTTSNRDALLPTIVSRCQQVRFDPLTEEGIRAELLLRTGTESVHATLVARLANGSFSRALELLEANVFEERAFVVGFIRNALAGSATKVVADVETIAGWKDRDQVTRFLLFVQMWFRDALVISRGGAIINLDQQEDLLRFVSRNPDADLLRALRETERAISLVSRNAYIKLVLLHLATKLQRTLRPSR